MSPAIPAPLIHQNVDLSNAPEYVDVLHEGAPGHVYVLFEQ